jgi:hypothetical protein
MKKLYVDFVSENSQKGFEGPFALETTILGLLHYKGITNDSSDSSSDSEESSSSEDDSSNEGDESSGEESDHEGEDDQAEGKEKDVFWQDRESSDDEQFDYSVCYKSTGERRGNPKYPNLDKRDSKRMRTRGDAVGSTAARSNLDKKTGTKKDDTKFLYLGKRAQYSMNETVYYYDPKAKPKILGRRNKERIPAG